MRSELWMGRILLTLVLSAPLSAAGDEPAGETPAPKGPSREQTVAPKPPPENTTTEQGVSTEPFVPSEKVSADTAIAFPVDI